jgi:hypothetical protein
VFAVCDALADRSGGDVFGSVWLCGCDCGLADACANPADGSAISAAAAIAVVQRAVERFITQSS